MSTWEMIIRYSMLGAIVYFLVLSKGTDAKIDDPDKTKMTIAILLLFTLLDVYGALWSRFKSYLCRPDENASNNY